MDKYTLIQLTHSIFIIKKNEACIALVTKMKHNSIVLSSNKTVKFYVTE